MNSLAIRVAGAIAAASWATACHAETAAWSEPAIDTWAYINGFGGGFRIEAPSFAGIAVDESTNQFEEGSLIDPARLGSVLVAFETADQITPQLEASRYAIHAAKFTVRLKSSSAGALQFSDQPITTSGLLSEAQNGGITSQKPFELFGVGFRGGYDGFALGPAQSGPRFSETTEVYASGGAGYVAYPIVGDGQGGLVDVSNNVTGGFSATAPEHRIDPFTATPWAIGDAGVSEGVALSANTTVTFNLDLTQPGVVGYLQDSLSSGAVGFFVSSLHPAGQQGVGGGAYPQWYTKEAVGVFSGAEAPTFSVEYSVLPIAGDYDESGVVDALDYQAWSSAYGAPISVAGGGADGSADGVVNAADYTVWRDAQAASTPSSAAIPEAAGVTLALLGMATAACRVGTPALTSKRRTRK